MKIKQIEKLPVHEYKPTSILDYPSMCKICKYGVSNAEHDFNKERSKINEIITTLNLIIKNK